MNCVKRKFLKVVVLSLVVAMLVPVNIKVFAAEKTVVGTPIYKAEDLMKMNNSSGSFYLANDINMEPYGVFDSIHNFSGVFNGNGYKIYNYIGDQGLFFSANRATIKNLGMENVKIISDKSAYGVGGIVGYGRNLMIDNCYVTGQISKTDSLGDVGGLVGEMSGTITNCYNAANIVVMQNCRLTGAVGGLVGTISGSMKYCYNLGSVTSLQTNDKVKLGGLVGSLCASSQIYHCYSAGTVYTANEERRYAGALIGVIEADAALSALYNVESPGLLSFWRYDDYASLFVGKTKTLTMSEMRDKASYEQWDFDTIWMIDTSSNNGLPTLQSMAEESEIPKASVKSGTYRKRIEVELSTVAQDAVIYYTLDGSNPLIDGGYIYEKPIVINETTTLKAVAIERGKKPSEIVDYRYSFSVEKPTASKKSKNDLTKEFKLELYTIYDDAKIYYTTNGKTPTIKSKVYTSGIKVEKDTVVKAIVVSNNLKSEVATFTYKFKEKTYHTYASAVSQYKLKNNKLTITSLFLESDGSDTKKTFSFKLAKNCKFYYADVDVYNKNPKNTKAFQATNLKSFSSSIKNVMKDPENGELGFHITVKNNKIIRMVAVSS